MEFNPGKTNTVADALSRRDEEVGAAHALSSPTFELYDEFRRETENLPDIIKPKEMIVAGTTSEAWSIVDGLVLHAGRVFVSSSSALWPKLLATAHGVGHEGTQKTLHRLHASFFNPHTHRLVRDYMKSCVIC